MYNHGKSSLILPDDDAHHDHLRAVCEMILANKATGELVAIVVVFSSTGLVCWSFSTLRYRTSPIG